MATAIDYDPHMSVLEARRRYFEANDFGEDGGYGARWVVLGYLGPLPIAFPNSKSRVRAVRYHDLHHLVTGYDTDLLGESEISAWELASGCKDMTAAWILNLLALPYGWWKDRERIERAFARGRRTNNLYGEAYDERLLATPLGELRGRLGLIQADDGALSTEERVHFRRMLRRGLLTQLALLTLLGGALALLVAVLWTLLA